MLYRSRNLGDMIQSVALSRLLPRSAGVYRFRLRDAPPDRLFVVNGFLSKDLYPETGGATCLFAGVSGPHYQRLPYLRWMRSSPFPIGARDQRTMNMAMSAGMKSVLIGCATITLPRHTGTRAGILSVDYPGPGERFTHVVSNELSVDEQWRMALAAINRYRTAEAVYTSRLHVALPCLASGTPVWVANPRRNPLPSRFSILEKMGLKYETLFELDAEPWARRFIKFLEDQLETEIEPGEPKLPTLPSDATRPWITHLSWLMRLP